MPLMDPKWIHGEGNFKDNYGRCVEIAVKGGHKRLAQKDQWIIEKMKDIEKNRKNWFEYFLALRSEFKNGIFGIDPRDQRRNRSIMKLMDFNLGRDEGSDGRMCLASLVTHISTIGGKHYYGFNFLHEKNELVTAIVALEDVEILSEFLFSAPNKHLRLDQFDRVEYTFSRQLTQEELDEGMGYFHQPITIFGCLYIPDEISSVADQYLEIKEVVDEGRKPSAIRYKKR